MMAAIPFATRRQNDDNQDRGQAKRISNQGHNNETHQKDRDSCEANRQGIETCRLEAKPNRGRDSAPRQIKGANELYSDGRSDAGSRLVEYARWRDA